MALENIPESDRADLDAIAPGGVASRIGSVLAFVEGLLNAVDPDLVSFGAVDLLNSHIAPLKSTLATLPEDEESWRVIDKSLDEACAAASSLVVAAGPLKALTQSASSKVARAVSARVSELDSATSASKTELAQLRSDIQQAIDDADAARSELVQQTEASTGALNARLEDLETQVDSFVSTAQGEHNAAQQLREEENATALQERATAFSDLVEEHRETLQAKLGALDDDAAEKLEALQVSVSSPEDALTSQADGALSAIDGVKTKVEDLYGAITQTGTAGAFGNEAKAQATVADNWRKIAVGFAFGAIVAAGVSAALVIWGNDEDIGVAEIVAKLAFTLVLGGVATYAAAQSSRHRHREEAAKQLELDLRAIAPFLEDIPDETARTGARTAFIERWMSSRTEAVPTSKDGLAGIPLDTLTQLASAINNRGGAQ